MIDFKRWIDNAVRFVRCLELAQGKKTVELSVSPPAEGLHVSSVSSYLRVPIPDEIRDFLTLASVDCSFHYTWTPTLPAQAMVRAMFGNTTYVYGGGEVCRVADFLNSQDACRWWPVGENLRNSQISCVDAWLNSFPFLPVRNGDFLAIRSTVGESKAPVIYLSHEEPWIIEEIGESFEQFLTEWEELCYIGPEIWMLNPFRNPETGYVDGNSAKANMLRSLFKFQ